jgi:hypothetical protein
MRQFWRRTGLQAFIDAHHANPKPFVWTKTADEILAKRSTPNSTPNGIDFAKLQTYHLAVDSLR